MKKQQEKILVAALAGIIVVSGAAFAIQPPANAGRDQRPQLQTSTLERTALFGADKAA